MNSGSFNVSVREFERNLLTLCMCVFSGLTRAVALMLVRGELA